MFTASQKSSSLYGNINSDHRPEKKIKQQKKKVQHVPPVMVMRLVQQEEGLFFALSD